ncbi:MAG: efflux RND transporter permease subunit [Proteobacteria bacterium]|nr:efflux RND transporter permease subunit [Cystobacterineae bacterium]MCL2258432.1 efflux RND transporter permease subunit [Cystobacterineae bacterium]MCL2315225.1 efflux RND transporter permease subunit [Pseudomonadota bacterium]
MNLTEISVRKPVLAWMIMAATVLFGVVAATRIGISQFPDVDFPTVNIAVMWEGAAPEAMERDVVEPIEETVMQVEGIKNLTSVSRQGSANITIEFDLKRNIDVALQEVQTKVAQAQRKLPKDMDPAIVSKTNPEDIPILWLGLAGPYSDQELSDYVRYRVKERLQTLSGVGEITTSGALERNIRIWIDSSALDRFQVTAADVILAIGEQHIELPSGYLETRGREISVRIMGEAFDLETIGNLVVRKVNGAPIYLKQVALIEDGFEDQRMTARVNGEPAKGLGIRKLRGANAVAVAKSIKAEMVKLNEEFPEGMKLEINSDSTQFIEAAVTDIQHELLLAILLTALVCWLFLGNLSSTMNVILAIPMSLLGTVAVIYFLGFTLNTFTLLGLSLAVGIVVDDAIMVMENIFRHAEMGKSKKRAALEGTAEITFAALAATIAIVAIFIPVIFMDGVIGKFFLQFGVTLCLAVLFSYAEAVTLAPARSAQILKLKHAQTSAISRWVDKAFSKLEQLYAWQLQLALKSPYFILVLAATLLLASAWVFSKLPAEFVPSQDQSRLIVRYQAAIGSSLSETSALIQRAESFMASRPETARIFTVIGGFTGNVASGQTFWTLKPRKERSFSQNELAGILRKELSSYPGLRVSIQDPSQSGFTAQRGYPIEFSVQGNDWDTLVSQANEVQQKFSASGLVVDLDSDYRLGQPELRIIPDRNAAMDKGIPVSDIANTMNALVGGVRVGKFNSQGRRIDIRTRLISEQRTRSEDIANLRFRTASSELIPLSSVATMEERPAFQAITRKNRERAITFFANPAPNHSQDEALKFVESLGKEMKPGYRIVFGGASTTFKESFQGLLFSLILGILVAYMVLAAQFNSFLNPVTVLTILPLSAAGAAFALWSFGITVNIFSLIGILLLMGIVKKNSIILVDYASQQRDKGLNAFEAMLRAGPVRLRPILMTSIATAMAAVPAAFGLGEGSETRRPMAIAVIGGLAVSTFLSLLVVPAFYVVADNIKNRLNRKTAQQPKENELDEPSQTHP